MPLHAGRPGGPADRGLRRVRLLTAADTTQAAAWAIRDLPVPPQLASALPGLLARLIGDETLRGACVEDVAADGATRQLSGLGLSGFLSDTCVSSYLDAPFPHLEVALLERARVPDSGSCFLNIDEIAEANAGAGLNLFLLFWLHHSNQLPDAERNALLGLGQQSSLRVHRGYRLKCILKDADARLAQAYLNGGFRELRRLPAGMPLSLAGGRSTGERIVFIARAEDIRQALPGTGIGPFFAADPPRCWFTRKQQKVLDAAVNNMTDREIAALLGTSANSLAQHWRRIYERIEQAIPALLHDLSAGEGTRGHEKRRRVVAYVAEHPEELRPYARTVPDGPGGL